MAVPYQELPLIPRILELIQVKSHQIIEKVAFNLSTKDVDLGAENIQSVAITPSWARTGRDRPRPLTGSFQDQLPSSSGGKKRLVTHRYSEGRACRLTCHFRRPWYRRRTQ